MSAQIDEVRAAAAILEADRDWYKETSERLQNYALQLHTRIRQMQEMHDLQEDYIKRLEEGYV